MLSTDKQKCKARHTEVSVTRKMASPQEDREEPGGAVGGVEKAPASLQDRRHSPDSTLSEDLRIQQENPLRRHRTQCGAVAQACPSCEGGGDFHQGANPCSSSITSIPSANDASVNLMKTLTKLNRTASALENKDVSTAQDQMDNAQQWFITNGVNEDSIALARDELRTAKKNAEKGYNGTSDILIKIHATKIICLATIYLNYPNSLVYAAQQCANRLEKLYSLFDVTTAFTVKLEGYTGYLSISYLLGSLSTSTNIVRQVCCLDETIFRPLHSAGLISVDMKWPQVEGRSPMCLAYDPRLVEESKQPFLTSLHLPGTMPGTGFLAVAATSDKITLISTDNRHIVRMTLEEDDIECIHGAANQYHPQSPEEYTNQFGAGTICTFRCMESAGKVWLFRRISSSKLSGMLYSITVTETPVVYIIDHQLSQPSDDRGPQGISCASNPEVVAMTASMGVVYLLVTFGLRAWVVTIETGDQVYTRSVQLRIHQDLLPFQEEQFSLLPGRLVVGHVNPHWTSDTEHLLQPGIYEYDCDSGDLLHADHNILNTSSHSCRINAASSEFLLVERRPCYPSNDKMMCVLHMHTWEDVARWTSNAPVKRRLACCLSPGGHVLAVLDDSHLCLHDLQNGLELSQTAGLRDGDLSPYALCWYGDRHVLLTFKNTLEIHQIPVKV